MGIGIAISIGIDIGIGIGIGERKPSLLSNRWCILGQAATWHQLLAVAMIVVYDSVGKSNESRV